MNRYFIDIEFANNKDLLQIGLVSKDENETWEAMINDYDVPKSITKLTGITSTVLKEKGINKQKLLNQLQKKLGTECVLYSYDKNDEIVLRNFLSHSKSTKKIKIRFVDISQYFSKKNVTLSLHEIAKSFDIKYEKEHDAIEDAKVLKQVFEKYISMQEKATKIIKPLLQKKIYLNKLTNLINSKGKAYFIEVIKELDII